MRKETIIKNILQLKKANAQISSLKKLGIHSTELVDPFMAQIEQSIGVIITDNEAEFEEIMLKLGWFLYDEGDKGLFDDKGVYHDLNSITDFTDYLLNNYGQKQYNKTKI